MSALGGILYFDGRDIDKGLLNALGQALKPWGPDGGREESMGSVGMAYRAFHTNRESRMGTQPLLSVHGHSLTWDGRLDNREDLLRVLRDELYNDHTDAAIVMAAYLKWKEDFLIHLIGDFALALWDPFARKLLLARDPFGTRPLFYLANAKQIFWSSTLESILELAEVSIEIDDEYIADYLSVQIPHPSRTPYVGIAAVEPGHIVTTFNGQVSARRFWGLDPQREIIYRGDSEYEEHFRHLFREAVRCRLRADNVVWVDLSGGLDSTSVVSMADRIIADGEAIAPGIKTVSYLAADTETADESKYIHYVEEQRGQPGFHLYSDVFHMKFAPPESHFRSLPSTGLCCYGGIEPLHQEMRRTGARVRLSGLGGDQLLWSESDPSPYLTDLLYECKFRDLHSSLQDWSFELKRPYLHLLWREAILPMLSGSIKTGYQSKAQPAPWLDHSFAARMKIRERSPMPADRFGYKLPGNRIRCSQLLFVTFMNATAPRTDPGTADMTHPFLDRRLVEFLLAIPFEQLLRHGETRSIQRRALRGLVPEKVLRRRYKGSVHNSFRVAFVREWPQIARLCDQARVCSRGYVEEAAMRAAFDLARHGGTVVAIHFLLTLSLEVWLRSLEHRLVGVERRLSEIAPQPMYCRPTSIRPV
jgi:asparagine synthase (glutamine-hydrolysing)